MRIISIASCALPGLLLGVCFAATAAKPQPPQSGVRAQPAIDAKSGRALRPLTMHERSNLAQSVANRQRHLKQPATEVQARPTLVRTGGGATTMQVPTSLWSNLSAQQDTQGKMRVYESEGTQAPVIKQEELK